MSNQVRLIDLLTTWLKEQFHPSYSWEKYSTYIEGCVFDPSANSWFNKHDITIWVQDPPHLELVEIEWWLNGWKFEKFKIIDPDLFVKLKDRIDTIIYSNPEIIRPLR